MISVEQVHALEERVEKAIAYISSLKSENAGLRRDLEAARAETEEVKARVTAMEGARDEAKAAQARIAELEAAAEAYRRDQASIEAGIVHALQKLDAFEDLVLRVDATRAEAARPAVPPGPAAVQPAPAEKPAVARPVAAHPAPLAEAPEPQPETEKPAGKTIDELSMEELEAATAPTKSPEVPAPQPLEGELDIF